MLRNKTLAPEFCSFISNWLDMREQAPGANLLHAVCFRQGLQEHALWCVLKFACRDMTCLQLANQIGVFFHPQLIANPNRVVSSFSSLVVSFVCTRERVSGACFRSKLPRVYQPLIQTSGKCGDKTCRNNTFIYIARFFSERYHFEAT